MPTPSEIMSERKEIVRQSLAASDRGDRATYEKLQKKAHALMVEAGQLMEKGGEFTSKDAYGLMGS